MSRVFVSYSNKDSEFVQRLVSDLEKDGHEVFYDRRISAGESWIEVLSSAIESAEYILAVLSPDYLTSHWAGRELQIGLLREVEKHATVIPLMIRACQLPAFIADKLYADFTRSYDDGLDHLLRALSADDREAADSPAPGDRQRKIEPGELDAIRAELTQAVGLFIRGGPPLPEKTKLVQRAEKQGKRKCFVVMPFGDENLDVVYEDFVKPVAEDKCGLVCERGDDVFGCNVIMDDIRTSIRDSDLVLADLSGKNANVFYEVGICHALEKRVLLLAQSIDDVPFDLRHRRVLLYEYTPRGCKRLEANVERHLLAMLE